MGSALKAAAVVLGCLVTLAGCGSATSSSGSSDSREKSSASSSCASDAAAFAQSTPVGTADVDGDGKPDAVKLTTGSKECPARLIAHVAEGYVGGELPGDDPAPASAFGVSLTGHDGDLLVTQQDHPRGGYQLHVFADGPDGLVELKDGEQPLIPFVATDTRPIPYTVDCTGNSIEVNEAVARSGGTWDLGQKTYSVEGSVAKRTGVSVLSSNLSPKRIDQLMPAGRPFADCRD